MSSDRTGDGFRRRATRGLITACAVAAVAALFPSCLEVRNDPADEGDPARCATCHGDPTRDGDFLSRAAPPIDLNGDTKPEYPGVGAHARHALAASTHGAVACDSCHEVPKSTGSPGHADDPAPAEVILGGLAAQGGRDPSYDYGTRTCTDTYCHGGTRSVWTEPRPRDETCGTCHGLPPPSPHVQSRECASCHGDVIDEDGTFAAPELHVDGTIQLSIAECSQCHGTGDDPAPPRDTLGHEGVRFIGVGAHQAHLSGGTASRPVECSECHEVPDGVDDLSHVDALPAELVFTGVADSRDHAPVWNHQTARCSDTWCHGPTPQQQESPKWTLGEALPCTGCHGMPPVAPHAQSNRCSDCHGAVVDDRQSIIDRSLHVDGTVQVAPAGCTRCHGSAEGPAPPRDTLGNEARSALGVGAHGIHLKGTRSSRPIACNECHEVPDLEDESAHIDGRPAEVRFTGPATSEDRSPIWVRGEKRCEDSWCHGPGQGAQDSPDWTSTRSLTCTGCHGVPPLPPHPQIDDCSLCHGAVVASDDVTIVEPDHHVDGTVDLNVPDSCTACHGGENPAPPPDLSGATQTTSPGVGAHQAHLSGTPRSRAVPCDECHFVPATVVSPGHLDTPLPAEVIFSGVAIANDATPTYEGERCTNTPCHGGKFTGDHLSGGTNTGPLWTRVDGTEATCGSCHGLPPPAPHPYGDLNPVCSACHENIDSDNLTFSRPDLHVDGVVTFSVP